MAGARIRIGKPEKNKLLAEDRPVHDWYRFVLSFPPHLVRNYLEKFGIVPSSHVLDPFCGTGTTLVECKKHGVMSTGIEANPMAHLASTAKLDWKVNPADLVSHANEVAALAWKRLKAQGVVDEPLPMFDQERRVPTAKLKCLDAILAKLILKDSISPLPLHKTLVLIEALNQRKSGDFHNHEMVALAKALVTTVGNLHFGPEVGIGEPKADAPVVSTWLAHVERMARDIATLESKAQVSSFVFQADARRADSLLAARSIDAVITSPPYPNEKDYTRTTRLESVLLGLIKSKDDLRQLKKGLVRSNTRSVYVVDDDDHWVRDNQDIQKIAKAIEKRRIALGKTSGFERLYARVTRLYFGGMARHLAMLRTILRPGAKLAYVVGDQASYLRVMIRTGKLLADIAESLGYRVLGIDLFRTRLATATKEQLREEVVVLEWPG